MVLTSQGGWNDERKKMNFYVCEYCGAAFEAESDEEAREIAEECAEL
jgi:DNA-directed RNA polymerase subunit RPC12/RpoP